jgi:hypothetical protein
MKWPHWYPTWADMMGILFVAVIVCLFAFAVIRFPDALQRGASAGFGPDRECKAVANSEPICIKKLGH